MTAYRDFVYADFQGYAYGYGWRFIDTRSAQKIDKENKTN